MKISGRRVGKTKALMKPNHSLRMNFTQPTFNYRLLFDLKLLKIVQIVDIRPTHVLPVPLEFVRPSLFR